MRPPFKPARLTESLGVAFDPTRQERTRYEPLPIFPSAFNNPVLLAPANFAGQDGDRAYPIHYKYMRHNAGQGYMFDTRDFVNHNLDSRSNDYTPRLVPDPSTIGGFQCAAGFTPPNPNGRVNAFNPPAIVHGLPPGQSSRYYFLQQ